MRKKADELRVAEAIQLDARNNKCSELLQADPFAEFHATPSDPKIAVQPLTVETCVANGLGNTKVLITRPLVIADAEQLDEKLVAFLFLRNQKGSSGTLRYGVASNGESLTYQFNPGTPAVNLRPGEKQWAKVEGERSARTQPIRVPLVATHDCKEYPVSLYVFGAHD